MAFGRETSVPAGPAPRSGSCRSGGGGGEGAGHEGGWGSRDRCVSGWAAGSWVLRLRVVASGGSAGRQGRRRRVGLGTVRGGSAPTTAAGCSPGGGFAATRRLPRRRLPPSARARLSSSSPPDPPHGRLEVPAPRPDVRKPRLPPGGARHRLRSARLSEGLASVGAAGRSGVVGETPEGGELVGKQEGKCSAGS